MAKTPNITPSLIERLKKKAWTGKSKFKIAAFAFSRKGNFLGSAANSVSSCLSYENYRKRCLLGEECKHSGKHAEKALIEKYGKRISTILIVRIGLGGEIRPIEPCQMCSKIADKLGIKIISVEKE